METIGRPDRPAVPPNLADFRRVRHDFTWSHARSWLGGLPGGRGLNMGYEAVDRHAAGPLRDVPAVRCVLSDDAVSELTYGELAEATDRFANLLADLGVGVGERVCTLLRPLPALYVATLGTLKRGAVHTPLFPAFGPEPVAQRLALADARVVVTTARAYETVVAPVRARLPGLRHVLIAGEGAAPPGTTALDEALRAAHGRFTVPDTDPEQPALLHVTSGTTGRPKGAVHVHDAAVAQYASALFALDLRPGDVFWCTADPGWAAGTTYGILAPLMHGVTVVADAADFEAHRWYRILDRLGVTVWYTTPTAVRMLVLHGDRLPAGYDLSRLRHVASVGEALDAAAVRWSARVLHRPIHDTWWQTETGAIMIANFPALDIHPGSMGLPLPGIDVALATRGPDGRARTGDGTIEPVGGPDVAGELVLRRGWPSMFRGYLGDEPRYAECFAGDWYLTGDVVRRDADGYHWFAGRADDVITCAGHLIGPYEVESTLLEHPAVLEAGVVGGPDPVTGERVTAYVTVRPGTRPDETLRQELLAFGRVRLGGIAPREVVFAPHLPHTPGGQVLRRRLRARARGRPADHLSTGERWE